MSRMLIRSALLIGATLAGVPLALACGDKVAALGGGVPFERLQATRITGQVVLLMSPDSGVQRIDDKAGLARALAFAGHSVRIVQRPELLETELRLVPANVVIADQAAVSRVAAGIRNLPTPPAVLVVVSAPPVGGAGRNPESGCTIRADMRQSRPVLRSVEHLVARQLRGSRADCLPTA